MASQFGPGSDVPALWQTPAFRYGILSALCVVILGTIICGIMHRRASRLGSGSFRSFPMRVREAIPPLPPRPVMWDAWLDDGHFDKGARWPAALPLSVKPTNPDQETNNVDSPSFDGPIQVAFMIAMPSSRRELCSFGKLDERELGERLGGALEMGIVSAQVSNEHRPL